MNLIKNASMMCGALALTAFAGVAATSAQDSRFGDTSGGAGAPRSALEERYPAVEVPQDRLANFQERVDRSVDLDEVRRRVRSGGVERFANGFGTISRDGTRTAADEETKDAARRAFQAYEDGAGQPARPFRGDRIVVGPDDRVPITNTTRSPFVKIGQLWTQDREGGWGTCSATLIGPRALLTAAHCVYDHDLGWGTTIEFAPAMNGDTAPFGFFTIGDAIIPTGYVDYYEGYYGSVVEYDIAVLEVVGPIGNDFGRLPFGYHEPPRDFIGNLVGYPGDKPDSTMWRASCDFLASNINNLIMFHYCDTAPGSSGSSIYDYERADDSRVILAINIASSPSVNLALRIDEGYFNWLVHHENQMR